MKGQTMHLLLDKPEERQHLATLLSTGYDRISGHENSLELYYVLRDALRYGATITIMEIGSSIHVKGADIK